jgi:general secretion pathway protein G
MNAYKTCRSGRGFTLIELLIVMTIIGILAAIAVPSYQRSVIRSRETVLAEDLFQMRHAIDAFYADNACYPEALEDLASKRYLRGIPKDPFTQSAETWEIVPPEAADEGETPCGSLYDVHSGSELVGLDGRPYNEW